MNERLAATQAMMGMSTGVSMSGKGLAVRLVAIVVC